MAKPMSWKWKLGIGVVCGGLFLTGFIFTPSGYTWMRGRIMDAYNELPVGERRASPLAQDFLSLAKFRGSVCLDTDTAMLMYKEFCGYNYKGLNGDEYMRRALATNKLEGICSPDGKTGWGPAHPDAPDAFFEYLDMYRPTHSSQYIKVEIGNYFRLFYTWNKTYSGTRKPHPKFMKYWPKLRDLGMERNVPWAQDIILNPPDVVPWAVEPKKKD